MAVGDDLRIIADRASRELDAVHDFFEHSRLVWHSFQTLVDEGHTFVVENRATGTSTDQSGLLRLAPHYTRHYLATFTFIEFVSVFETFFFALLHRVLQHNPWPLAKSRLEFEEVIRAGDRDELVSAVILRQLNDVKYQRVPDWFEMLNKTVKLDYPTDANVAALAEIKAARDLLQHNGGVVNDVYVRKAGSHARYAAGDVVEIDEDYHLASWRLIKKVVGDVSAAAIARLAKP